MEINVVPSCRAAIASTPIVALLLFSHLTSARAEEIPPHQAQRIEQAAPAEPTVAPKKKRRVLIFVTPVHLMEKDPHKGYCIPYGTYALKTLGTKTRAFEPVVSQDLANFLPENIRQFDAILLNNTSGPWIIPTDADMQRDQFRKHGTDKAAVEQVLRDSLLRFVEQGGGLAALHFAIGANQHWPQFRELLGARYGGHPWNEEVGVKLDEPQHPLNAAFGGKGFRITEEIYQFAAPYSRDTLRVLFSLDTSSTNMNVPWIDRKDGDFALGWVRSHGKGRVFYTAFGHRTELYWNPAILQLYLDGIQFATGDLQAPTEPGNKEPITRDAAGQEADSDLAFRAESDDGISLFNGRDLSGWEGDENIWSVRDGAIMGATSKETGLKVNNFLIWKGGQPRDFELRLKFKLIGGNSGIYFRCEKQPEGEPLIGPQADFSADHRWTGVLMEWKKRDVLAERGQRVLIGAAGNKQVIGSLGDPQERLKAVKDQDWNDYTVIAKGESVILKINGVTMCEVTDQDPRRPKSGHLALQVHVGPPMTVQFKDIWLKED
jgi:type 1 glutamine amidotransferase